MENETTDFEKTILPHFDAAYNLARWLTGNEHDARDMVQESCLRAFKFFGGFRGGDARSWLLTIVRNTAYSWLQRRQKGEHVFQPEEEMEKFEDVSVNPEQMFARSANIEVVREADAVAVPPQRRGMVSSGMLVGSLTTARATSLRWMRWLRL